MARTPVWVGPKSVETAETYDFFYRAQAGGDVCAGVIISSN
jgi:hypothetical protein